MNKKNCFIKVKIFIFLFVVSIPIPVFSLEPDEILVVANPKMEGSVALARYYMEHRLIPQSHFLPLSLTTEETMSRTEYDDILKNKVLDTIIKLRPKNRIAAIVLIYGVPLKVAPPRPDSDYLEKLQYLEANNTIEDGQKQELNRLRKTHMRAAVDSELALVLAGDYELDGWIQNPYFLGFQEEKLPVNKDQVLLVTRLDGPDPAIVYRIINDSLETEKNGLQGKAYFDARWPLEEKNDQSGYKRYDQSIHRAAAAVKKRMQVIVDEQEELFPENSCPEAALYCGWYSLAKYVDSFSWQKGAIGYHIASAECSTLRDKNRPIWCVQMLEKGVAATIGPVHEPYVQGFPLPELFFGHLIEGYMSLGEAYLISLPFLSWQTILIGDPLYQPFSVR
ncbi:MAG: TIGR03790 family protein [Desulforhopalus sp.]